MDFSPPMIVDACIAALIVVAAITGWRQGAISSVLQAVLITAALVLGLAVTPLILTKINDGLARWLIAIAIVLLLTGLANWGASVAGASLRDKLRGKTTRRIDSGVGAIFQAVFVLFVVYLVSIPVVANVGGKPAQIIRGSAILKTVSRVSPGHVNHLPDKLSALLSDTGLPPVMSPFEAARKVDVAPPPKLANQAMVDRVRPSIVRVDADAHRCARRMTGSGFIIEGDLVITNAHVVAGADRVTVDTVLGTKRATVVTYDPAEDIAVLKVPGIDLPHLAWSARMARSGDVAVVMGFPGSGPFRAVPARIRQVRAVDGPDIYATRRISRTTYTVKGPVMHGNSGGPLVDAAGNVLGVVFAASVDDTDTGYVLTAPEVTSHLHDIAHLTTPVSTGRCVAR